MSVASTYAEALFAAARERRAVEQVAADLGAFVAATAESDELGRVLASPEIETRAKKATVAALAEGAHPLVANFLQVLIDRGRIGELSEIAEAFADRVAEAEGRLEVEAVTAVPLTDDLRRKIVERVQSETGRAATLTESVDPEIIGGLVLRVGGVVVDGSLRTRLEGLRRALRGAAVDAAVSSS